MAKEAVNRAFESAARRRRRCSSGALFHSLFATEDQKEGMDAFLAKRKPDVQSIAERHRSQSGNACIASTAPLSTSARLLELRAWTSAARHRPRTTAPADQRRSIIDNAHEDACPDAHRRGVRAASARVRRLRRRSDRRRLLRQVLSQDACAVANELAPSAPRRLVPRSGRSATQNKAAEPGCRRTTRARRQVRSAGGACQRRAQRLRRRGQRLVLPEPAGGERTSGRSTASRRNERLS